MSWNLLDQKRRRREREADRREEGREDTGREAAGRKIVSGRTCKARGITCLHAWVRETEKLTGAKGGWNVERTREKNMTRKHPE